MRDLISNVGDLMNERLDLAQHMIDPERQLIELVTAALGRQPLAQIARLDPLDSLVDLRQLIEPAEAQDHSDPGRQRERWKEAERERAADDLGNLLDLFAAENKGPAVVQRMHQEPHG